MKNYGEFTAWLIVAWFICVLSASALGLFENESNRIGVEVAFAAVTPIALFALWYAGSDNFRQFVLSVNARTLTYIQAWRLAGLLFVVLATYGILPAIFAIPAGYGDMAIGATAPAVAMKLVNPKRRNAFLAWQAIGMADLVMAVTLGTTARLFSPVGTSMGAMTVLPLSLVPTFIVPLLFIFHIICIAQAKSWRTSTREGARLRPHPPRSEREMIAAAVDGRGMR
jgi:hypothetical protein